MSKILEISNETYQKIRHQLTDEEAKEINSYEDMIGEKYFFRTVTYHMVGKVVKIVGKFLYLEDASWIADSGRFSDFIKKGVNDNSEVEPVGDMYVNIEAVTDFFPYKNTLELKQQ